MIEVLWKVLVWSTTYLLIALLPLAVAMLGHTPEGRGFWIEFGVGLGIVGFAMLGLQFVTTTRFRWIAPYFGTQEEHDRMGEHEYHCQNSRFSVKLNLRVGRAALPGVSQSQV